MTREEWIDQVGQRARAMADQAGVAWPSEVRLHDRHGDGVAFRYAVSVHAGAEAAQKTLILWSQRSDCDEISGIPIAEPVWSLLSDGASTLGWRHGT